MPKNWNGTLHDAIQWKKLLNNLTKLRTVSVKRHLFLNPANDRDAVEDSVLPEAMLDGSKVSGGNETVEFELNNETFPDFGC